MTMTLERKPYGTMPQFLATYDMQVTLHAAHDHEPSEELTFTLPALSDTVIEVWENLTARGYKMTFDVTDSVYSFDHAGLTIYDVVALSNVDGEEVIAKAEDNMIYGGAHEPLEHLDNWYRFDLVNQETRGELDPTIHTHFSIDADDVMHFHDHEEHQEYRHKILQEFADTYRGAK